jgi:hypothetical protein
MRRWLGFDSGFFRNWFARPQRPGAIVPFEAPALRMARVCSDERDGLIAVLHGLYRALEQPAAGGGHDGA